MATYSICGFLNFATELVHSPDPDERDLVVHDQRAREIRYDHSVLGRLKRRLAGNRLAPLGSLRYELEQAALLYGAMAAWRENALTESAEDSQWRVEITRLRQREQELSELAARAPVNEAGRGQITTTTEPLEDGAEPDSPQTKEAT